MLGGGVFVTQGEKVLPGSYINVVNRNLNNVGLGERGVVAIALWIGKAPNTVIEVTKSDFYAKCKTLLGVEFTDTKVAPLREIFCNANKVYVFDLGATFDDDNEASAHLVACNAFEAYEFNVLCAYTNDNTVVKQYMTFIKTWRDTYGKKCQLVVYNQDAPDYEGIINVCSTVATGDAHALVAWVAGAEAGCKINESCTNKKYDGEYTINYTTTQSALEAALTTGKLVFHLVYGDIRVLEDINSFTTTTAEKGEDFKYNQTIRVIDQIANDIAKMFNTKYIGKVANTESGRVGLWGDIVKHHRQLEEVGAIENYDSSLLTVVQGDNKKTVVVNDVITVVNAMAQLYMTVVVQ